MVQVQDEGAAGLSRVSASVHLSTRAVGLRIESRGPSYRWRSEQEAEGRPSASLNKVHERDCASRVPGQEGEPNHTFMSLQSHLRDKIQKKLLSVCKYSRAWNISLKEKYLSNSHPPSPAPKHKGYVPCKCLVELSLLYGRKAYFQRLSASPHHCCSHLRQLPPAVGADRENSVI